MHLLETMPAGKLIDDITFIIFKHATYMETYSTSCWKKRLELLSISQHLRSIALPMVYNTVGVSCSALEPCPDTNASIFALSNYTTLARCLEINISNAKSALVELNKAIKTLSSYAQCWDYVKTIKVCIKYAHNSSEGNSPAELCKIKEVIEELRALAPNVTSLTFGKSNSGAAQFLYGRLADEYAAQAKSLIGSQPVAINNITTFTKLAHLNVKLDKHNYQLPITYADSLEYLAMENVPQGFAWDTFIGVNKKLIAFSQLKTLKLAFNPFGSPESNSQKFKLQFPSLRNLNVQNIAGFCQLIEKSQFPKIIRNLWLIGSVRSIDMLQKAKLPSVDRLTLSIVCINNVKKYESFSAVNQLKWKGNEYTTADVFLHGCSDIAIPSKIECRNLGKLVISAPTDISNLLLIIQGLPTLTVLTLFRIVTKDTQLLDAISESAAGDGSYVQPYRTKIKSLTFTYRNSESPESNIVALIQHLVIRMRSLEGLHALQVPSTPVIDYANAYAVEHPHLANIRFALKQHK